MVLEERFTAPAGWRTGEFVHLKTGHTIHYATVSPENPKAVAVILPGLSEFSEKYHETARDLLARNLSVWIIDWAFQGRSSRWSRHPMRRHTNGFDADIQDLHKLVSDHVLPAAQDRPLVMIGHSMGGHIGLRYLAEHQGIFKAAAFSAPMLGIHDVNKIPSFIRAFLLCCLKPFGNCYVPFGRDWHESLRKSDGTDVFSSDPVRDALHNDWSKTHPELQVGSPTLSWIFSALVSCKTLEKDLPSIDIPLLIVSAEDDRIVDNNAIAHAAAVLPQGTLLRLPEARHEILMERDDIRNRWFEGFDKLLTSVNI